MNYSRGLLPHSQQEIAVCPLLPLHGGTSIEQQKEHSLPLIWRHNFPLMGMLLPLCYGSTLAVMYEVPS